MFSVTGITALGPTTVTVPTARRAMELVDRFQEAGWKVEITGASGERVSVEALTVLASEEPDPDQSQR